MAVAKTFSAARESAARGDYADALAWLALLDAIGHRLSQHELSLRERWRTAFDSRRPCTQTATGKSLDILDG